MAIFTVGSGYSGIGRNAIGKLPNGNLAIAVYNGSAYKIAYTTDGGANWSLSATAFPTGSARRDMWLDPYGRWHYATGGTSGADVNFYLGTPNEDYTDWTWSSATLIDGLASDEDCRDIEVHGIDLGSGAVRVEVAYMWSADDATYGYDDYWYSCTVFVSAANVVTKDASPLSIATNVNEASSTGFVSTFIDGDVNTAWYVGDMPDDLGKVFYQPSGGSVAQKGTNISRDDGAYNIFSDGTYIWSMIHVGATAYLIRTAISDGAHTEYSLSLGAVTVLDGMRICLDAAGEDILCFVTVRTGSDPYTQTLKLYVFDISEGTFGSATDIDSALNESSSQSFHYGSTRIAVDGVFIAYKFGYEDVLYIYSHNVAPNAPTGLIRNNFDATDPALFEWTFDDDDAGDSQSAFKLRLRAVGSGTWLYAQSDGSIDSSEVWITSTSGSFLLDGGELINAEDYEWNVATKDASGEAGPFAASDATFSTVAAAVRIIGMIPLTGHDVIDAPQEFEVTAASSDASTCTVYVELDTADTFDTANLIQEDSGPLASGSTHTVEAALTGSQTWYWRAKAKRSSDNEETAWSDVRTLDVDTGGALPSDYSPDPDDGAFLNDVLTVTFTATLDHVLTPTADATLRLQAELDTTDGFADPQSKTSEYTLPGHTASVTFEFSSPGVYWVRFRALADYGDDSAWDTYELAVRAVSYFIREPSWQAQVGPRPNRVFVRIQGGTTIKTAAVPDLGADEYVDYWAEVPSDTTESDAQSTANAILAVLQARPLAVSGVVPLNVRAEFGRLVVAQWWELDGDHQPTMRETATLSLARKEHDIDAGTTTLHLGDVVPSDSEALARILAKLSRK